MGDDQHVCDEQWGVDINIYVHTHTHLNTQRVYHNKACERWIRLGSMEKKCVCILCTVSTLFNSEDLYQ